MLTTPGAHFDEIEAAGAGLVVEESAAGILHGLLTMIEIGRAGMKAKGQKGRVLVQQKYCWPDIVKRYEEICLEALEKKGGA